MSEIEKKVKELAELINHPDDIEEVVTWLDFYVEAAGGQKAVNVLVDQVTSLTK